MRDFERLVLRGEDRARIGHARIEPGLVKFVAKIVMRFDVAASAARRVAAKAVERAVRQSPKAFRARDLAERPAVAHEEVEQRHRVGARPFARGPGAVPADRAGRDEPHERAPAVQVDDRHWSRRAAADQQLGPVGQRRVDAAFDEPAIDGREYRREGAAHEARSQPSRRTVGHAEFRAGLAGPHIHGGGLAAGRRLWPARA
ncbi:MAG: hypothetical protein AVDCRST_MAG91-1811 [uncultured Sphingomonadaceae bacterium]|uniref:Uncharacterized protein n=1 Tax=uncultured Sphingomonadaceae bacterium TaxID=169976 RepID=A0A6J4T5E3_9SPHN|nr:MAG: hypothetical protein AVDCRST_MAG91-1811 [uncultured Sphingomonadaceae bacterium]